jgi:N-acyl-D-amino-acid deacylase
MMRPLRWTLSLLVVLAGCGVHLRMPEPRSDPHDVIIAGGMVVDGTGSPPYRADVAIVGRTIVAIGPGLANQHPARRVIDATGLIVAPGFIDLHAHLEPLLDMPGAESHLRQGVTLALGGPDGSSALPVRRWLDSAGALGLGINVATLVGHNTVRRAVMGTADRAPAADELSRMQRLVAEAMGDGAFGISTGLAYVPGAYSTTDEVVALARVAADSFGIYTSHMRDEARQVMESIHETLEIGRRAGIPVVITHAKVVGRPSWGRSVEMLAAVDSARAAGYDVMLDVYPYAASHTGIGLLVPAWSLADGDTAFARRVRDPVLRDSIIAASIDLIENERGGGDLRFVQFSRVPWQRDLEGRTLADWARSRGLEPSARIGAELVIEALLNGGANAVYHVMNEDDVRRIMAHPMTMIASDGRLTRFGEGHPHPRAYGTFPRVLGRYVREEGVLTLEQAIAKMTWMPAERLGLYSRGRVLESMVADLVIFDPATIADRATYTDPHQYPVGIHWVIINGVVAVERGELTGARAGEALSRVRCDPPSCQRFRATRR